MTRVAIMNNSFIYIVLFTAFVITVAKLYYEQTLRITLRTTTSSDDDLRLSTNVSGSNDSRAMCPVLGYRCIDAEHCDCQRICGREYDMYRVGDNEKIVLTTHELAPGSVYCVPKSQICDRRAARPIYTTDGWSCVARHPQLWTGEGKKVACTSPYAQTNDLNVLHDTVTNEPVEIGSVIDAYERKAADGSFRYQCKCQSLDHAGNRMIAVPSHYPFACFTDHCKRDVSSAAIVGWNGSECDCGPLSHLDPSDKTSPCVRTATRIDGNHLTVHVPCVDALRLNTPRHPFYCPDTYGVTGQTKNVNDVFFRKTVVLNAVNIVEALKKLVTLR